MSWDDSNNLKPNNADMPKKQQEKKIAEDKASIISRMEKLSIKFSRLNQTSPDSVFYNDNWNDYIKQFKTIETDLARHIPIVFINRIDASVKSRIQRLSTHDGINMSELMKNNNMIRDKFYYNYHFRPWLYLVFLIFPPLLLIYPFIDLALYSHSKDVHLTTSDNDKLIFSILDLSFNKDADISPDNIKLVELFVNLAINRYQHHLQIMEQSSQDSTSEIYSEMQNHRHQYHHKKSYRSSCSEHTSLSSNDAPIKETQAVTPSTRRIY